MNNTASQSERATKKHMPRSLLIAISVAVLAVAIVLAILLSQKEDLPPNSPITSSEIGGYQLSTPVGSLTIPQELADSAEVRNTSENGQYAVSFYGKIGGGDVLLFELSIGDKETGYLLGSAPDADGNMCSVWLDINEIKRESDWSVDDYLNINELQSYVNDLIFQINQLDGFVSED